MQDPLFRSAQAVNSSSRGKDRGRTGLESTPTRVSNNPVELGEKTWHGAASACKIREI